MKKCLTACVVLTVLFAVGISGFPLTFFDATSAGPTPLLINEICFNPTGADAPNEYVEIRGGASAVIPAGTYLIGLEGDSGAPNPGDVQTIFDLSGITLGTNGYLVLRQNGSTYTVNPAATTLTAAPGPGFGGLAGFSQDAGATDVENATSTFLLIQTGSVPLLTDDVDANDDGTPDGAVYPGWTILDSVAILDGATDFTYGNLTIANGTGGTATGNRYNESFVAGYVARRGDTTGSFPSEWVASSMGATTGTAPNWDLGDIAGMYPDSLNNALLNHIGGTNASFVPTAAAVSVSGRVVTSDGSGIAKARMTITGGSLTAPHSALTNGFGYYMIDGLTAGETYVISVGSKRSRFQTPSRVVTLNDNLAGVDFVADP